MESCVKTLTEKLESSQQPPKSVDLPNDKGQRPIKKDFTTLQKTQVIPNVIVEPTQLNNPLKEKVGDNPEMKSDQPSAKESEVKDNSGNNPNPSSDIKMEENEEIALEEMKVDQPSDEAEKIKK